MEKSKPDRSELAAESGDLTISAADDAIHCDYTLQIGAEGTDWPAISITDCDEGLEAAALHVASICAKSRYRISLLFLPVVVDVSRRRCMGKAARL